MNDLKKWRLRDYLGLTIIPLEFMVGTLISEIPALKASPEYLLIASVSLFLLGFLIMVLLFRDILAEQWHHFRAHFFWRKILLTLVLVGGAFLLLQFSRSLLPVNWLVYNSSSDDSSSQLGVGFMLFASLQPFMAPFAEELTFRYLLFGKIKAGVLQLIMFFVSSILFGLVHLNNFGGNWLATIPYMIIGAYFALIYYFSKNIWNSILVHWIFNSINSIIPALFLVILHLLGAY